MSNMIYGTQVLAFSDGHTKEEQSGAIVKALVEGMRSKDLSAAITLIDQSQKDGSWQEVRTLVNETLSLFYVETESNATILSEHTGCGIWSGPALFAAH